MSGLPYPKVETLFTRGPDFKLTNQLRRPEFGLIDRWILTEKIDGMNIRLHYDRLIDAFQIGGRTNNALLPQPLRGALVQLTNGGRRRSARHICEDYDITTFTLYGEGYGPGIQRGGGYRDTPGFVLFDVLVNGRTWLSEAAVTETADRLDLLRVPTVTVSGTPVAAAWLCARQVTSILEGAEGVVAEGVVARTAVPVFDSRGRRVQWKLKASDYRT